MSSTESDRIASTAHSQRPSAQRPVNQALDQHTKEGATDHGAKQNQRACPERVLWQHLPELEADKRADHEDIGVREVDEPKDAVNHRVAECDERIDGTEGKTVKKLLEKFGHREGKADVQSWLRAQS